MKRQEILSKLNIRDYGNKLEKIVAKKAFSVDTKNLLLSMFYKMEASYEDYNKVKVDTKLKKDILEEMLKIIEIDCKYIEIAKSTQTKAEIAEERKNLAVKRERRVITHANERDLIHELYSIRIKKFEVSPKYAIIKKSMENLLNSGNSLDGAEIIRDFDGWSWSTVVSEIGDLYLNIIYQNIRILMRK